MRNAVLKRLGAVEERRRPSHIIILAKDQRSGEMAEMTVHECIRRDCEFIRVVRAGALSDLDMLFQDIRRKA